MTSPESTDGGLKESRDDTVMGDSDVVPNLALRTNTDINAISSLLACPLETITPVWKYSDFRKRKTSVAAIASSIWKKNQTL